LIIGRRQRNFPAANVAFLFFFVWFVYFVVDQSGFSGPRMPGDLLSRKGSSTERRFGFTFRDWP
jgi:hypothetical protein